MLDEIAIGDGESYFTAMVLQVVAKWLRDGKNGFFLGGFIGIAGSGKFGELHDQRSDFSSDLGTVRSKRVENWVVMETRDVSSPVIFWKSASWVKKMNKPKAVNRIIKAVLKESHSPFCRLFFSAAITSGSSAFRRTNSRKLG